MIFAYSIAIIWYESCLLYDIFKKQQLRNLFIWFIFLFLFKTNAQFYVIQGHYVVKDGVFNIPGILNIIPGWLVSGDYYVSGVGYQNGKRLGCYSVYASITD